MIPEKRPYYRTGEQLATLHCLSCLLLTPPACCVEPAQSGLAILTNDARTYLHPSTSQTSSRMCGLTHERCGRFAAPTSRCHQYVSRAGWLDGCWLAGTPFNLHAAVLHACIG